MPGRPTDVGAAPAQRQACVSPLRNGSLGLTPFQDLEPTPGPGNWLASGPDPQFVAACSLPAGWIVLRVRMTVPAPTWLELFADTGRGFIASHCGLRALVAGAID